MPKVKLIPRNQVQGEHTWEQIDLLGNQLDDNSYAFQKEDGSYMTGDEVKEAFIPAQLEYMRQHPDEEFLYGKPNPYEQYYNWDAKNGGQYDMFGLSLLAPAAIGLGAVAAPAVAAATPWWVKAGVNLGFGLDGLHNLASENGLAKTKSRWQQGRYRDAALSGAGDALNALMVAGGAGAATKLLSKTGETVKPLLGWERFTPASKWNITSPSEFSNNRVILQELNPQFSLYTKKLDIGDNTPMYKRSSSDIKLPGGKTVNVDVTPRTYHIIDINDYSHKEAADNYYETLPVANNYWDLKVAAAEEYAPQYAQQLKFYRPDAHFNPIYVSKHRKDIRYSPGSYNRSTNSVTYDLNNNLDFIQSVLGHELTHAEQDVLEKAFANTSDEDFIRDLSSTLLKGRISKEIKSMNTREAIKRVFDFNNIKSFQEFVNRFGEGDRQTALLKLIEAVNTSKNKHTFYLIDTGSSLKSIPKQELRTIFSQMNMPLVADLQKQLNRPITLEEYRAAIDGIDDLDYFNRLSASMKSNYGENLLDLLSEHMSKQQISHILKSLNKKYPAIIPTTVGTSVLSNATSNK